MKKRGLTILSLTFFAMCALLFAGCGQSRTGPQKVAVLFADSSESWRRNANTLRDTLEKDGVVVDLRFAGTTKEQIEQLHQVSGGKADVIILGAVDANALQDALDGARKKQIPVIAYDRLITKSNAVSYFVAYDSKEVGRAQGHAIEKALRLKEPGSAANVELFAGDNRDHNSVLFFEGAMDILRPYIDNGRLSVPSGKKNFAEVITADWARDKAKARMAGILSANYSNGRQLHAILSPNDNLAGGIREALDESYSGDWPFITGLDCDPEALRAIAENRQGITIDKPPLPLAKKCRALLRELRNGSVDTKDAARIYNGVIEVPSFLCLPVVIDKSNIDSVSTAQ